MNSSPWDRFRNLCHYYADCVKYSEKRQEYVFPDRLGKDFLLPPLPPGWHLGDSWFEIATGRNDAYARNLLLQCSAEDEIFIGYPLHAFKSPDGFDCLCPVMLFPVDIGVRGTGYATGLKLKIDRPGISLNQDWIDYHVPRLDRTSFRRACERAMDEAGVLDVSLVLDFMRAAFPDADIDPSRMQFSVRRADATSSLLNTAVLFAGTKTKYAKNLLSELGCIAKEPDAVLDKTALAFVFRDPPLPNESRSDDQRRIPASFTKRPMNAGQFHAVEEALNRPLAKVTGPPGTGKFFMAVNLIANEVLHGGSVLFTSKNHKAIHAIFDKAPDAMSDRDFPLVQFCTTPDNPTNTDWRKTQKDVDLRVDLIALRQKCKTDIPATNESAVCKADCAALDVALSAYRDAEAEIFRRQELCGRLSRCEQALERLDALLADIPAAKRDSSDATEMLEEINAILARIPKEGFLTRIADFLRRIAGQRKRAVDWRIMMADFAPRLTSTVVTQKTIMKEVRRLLELLKYRELVRVWQKSEFEAIQAKQGDANYEALKEAVVASLTNASKHAQGALMETIVERVGSIAETESIVARCSDVADSATKAGPLEFLSSVDDGKKYDDAVNAFRDYLGIFPAWAATMLSLRRAAPCLPAVYTLAVIDEASQCDIPPMIPVLFRARRVAIIGDPNQFPPVITLPERRDLTFRRRYRIDGPELRKFSFRDGNAFTVAPGAPLLLNEHFRCADGIASYFNEEFYDGGLSLCCETGRTDETHVVAQTDPSGGLRPGMAWIDAPGGDEAEMEAALEYLRGLKLRGYGGSIGIISPLRELANRFKTRVADRRGDVPPQLDIQSQISTANGFQGAECDVILFLLGLNESRSHGEEWYVTARENKYIYNVSVSRAKHLFVAFGDRRRVAQSGLRYIERLIPENRPTRKANVGPGEERLRVALQRAGIETVPQYPVLGRYLDLAIPHRKIDIEVDGQAWHLDRFGGRKSDDIHRDAMLEAAGWHVLRFWHVDVVNQIDLCVGKVREALNTLASSDNRHPFSNNSSKGSHNE